MARCYPNPPSSSQRRLRKESRRLASIETIEFQNKKEKKRERLENKKFVDVIKGGNLNVKKVDAEQLDESSSLTEEHGHPAIAPGCHLSDKRKPPTSEPENPRRNVIRIKLTPSICKGLDSLQTREQPCSSSTSVKTEPLHHTYPSKVQKVVVKHENNKQAYLHDPRDQVYNSRVGVYENKCDPITSEKVLTNENCKKASAHHSKADENKYRKREEYKFRKFIDSLLPPHVPIENLDDEDWLFGSKKHPSFKTSDNVLLQQRKNLWPSALYLHEADVLALPYTIPF